MTPQYVDITLANDRDPANDSIALAVAGAAAAGKSCDISIWLQSALQNDARVQAAFAQMPRKTRSVANALMLWDQGWVRAEPAAAPGVREIADAVASGVRAAPEACRTALVRGPELITLNIGDETVVVAIGSGQWTWQSLLEPKAAAGSAAPAPTKGRFFDIFAARR